MDINSALQALRDPLGVPFFPWVFQLLMVLTFALHILFVNLVVGGLALAVYEHFKGGDFNLRLSKALAQVSTVNLSVAIVLGVAPLLFVQVIYDPFWYASNSLSAWWAMAFLLVIALGFLATYVFYLKRKKSPQGYGLFGVSGLVFVLCAGIIISALSVQALVPQKWLEWYSANGGLATTGTSLYHFEIGRFSHFIVPAFINIGIFMMLYAWYFRPRADADAAYLDWVGRSGAKMAKIAAMIQVVVGFWWLLTVPADLHFMRNPFLWIGASLGLLLLVGLMKAESAPDRYAIPMALLSFVAILGMGTAREALRMAYLGVFDYSIYTYPLNIDWGSTALFLVTFVMGLVVIAYPMTVAFKLGRGTLTES
ncbi:MAG: hypothetical protein JXR80_08710 [Deltaproteobacteria bacterium]|nr:hypothetical protein [Deltaproteobacteria bacterium]